MAYTSGMIVMTRRAQTGSPRGGIRDSDRSFRPALFSAVVAATGIAIVLHAAGDRRAIETALQGTPIADAGPDRFAMDAPIALDGTGSANPGGHGELSYQWSQVSGPPVVISDFSSAKPVISGFAQTEPLSYPKAVLQLRVRDGIRTSAPDTVAITLLPIRSWSRLEVENPPFDPGRPTIVFFGGGDGSDGGEPTSGLTGEWTRLANIINFHEYTTGTSFSPTEPPYVNVAEQLLAFLSAASPDYDQPIQLVGFSTGARPAASVGEYINTWKAFCRKDTRYNITRITLLDGYLPDKAPLTRFREGPVGGEPNEVDCYDMRFRNLLPGALSVRFVGGSHSTPHYWFNNSIAPDAWVVSDIFNHGITAGAFISVIGPARDLRLPRETYAYHFKWTTSEPGTLTFFDKARSPGRLPRPVALKGPRDGAKLGPKGAVFSCLPSENATAYRLLFGRDPRKLTRLVSDTPLPPTATISSLPFATTYWTIEVRERSGATIAASPRAVIRK